MGGGKTVSGMPPQGCEQAELSRWAVGAPRRENGTCCVSWPECLRFAALVSRVASPQGAAPTLGVLPHVLQLLEEPTHPAAAPKLG